MDFESKNKLRNVLERGHVLNAAKYFYRAHYFVRHIKHERRAKKLMEGESDGQFQKLYDLRDTHCGDRCFVVATGPSLRNEDLEKIKNEITFSLNSIVKVFGKTSWRPTYYCVQDNLVYNELKTNVDFINIKPKFIADVISEQQDVEQDAILYPLDLLEHFYYKPPKFRTKFSDDAYKIVYDGATVAYSAIQIAVYMGFTEIYLLGFDCDYSGPVKHFGGEYKHVDASYRPNEDFFFDAYRVAREYADSHGISIYNATRGGKLEVFERVDLDSLFL